MYIYMLKALQYIYFSNVTRAQTNIWINIHFTIIQILK